MPEYLYGNDVFTEEEVKQKADQLGVTLDEYLKLYPEVKLSDAGKQKGTAVAGPVAVSSTGSKSESGSSEPPKIHSWLDDKFAVKSFFDQEDERAVEELRVRYPGFEFSEVTFMATDRGGSFAGVKVTSPDGEDSIEIELNLDGMASLKGEVPYNSETAKLKEFIDKYRTEEFDKKYETKKQQISDFTSRLNKAVSLNTEEKEEVNSKFPSTDIFDPITPDRTEGKYKHYGSPKTIYPHRELLDNIYKELLKSNDKDIADLMKDPTRREQAREYVEDVALIRLKSEEELKIKKNKVKGLYIEAKDDAGRKESSKFGDIDFPMSELLESIWDPKVDSKELEGFLTVGSQNFLSDYAEKITLSAVQHDDILNLKSKLDAFTEKLQDPKHKFELTEDDVQLQLNNGNIISEREFNQYNNNVNVFNQELSNFKQTLVELAEEGSNVKDVNQRLALARKNYGILNKMAVKTGAAFIDFYANMSMGVSENPEQQKALTEIKAMTAGLRANYRDAVEFDDAFSSVSNFFEWTITDMLTEQAPILAALASGPVGYVSLGGSVFGDKYSRMTIEDIEAEVAAETFGIESKKRSILEKAVVAGAYTAPELILDYLFTGARIRGIQSMSKVKGAPRTIENISDAVHLKRIVGNIGYNTVSDAFGGGMSEGVTQIIQNAIDGVPLSLHLAEAVVAGVLLDAGLGSIPSMKGVYLATMSDNATYEFINEQQAIIDKYAGYTNSISPALREIAIPKVEEAVKKRDDKIAELESKILGTGKHRGLSKEAAKVFYNLRGRMETLRTKYDNLLKDNNLGLSEDAKTEELDNLKLEFETLQSLEQDVLKNGFSHKAQWEIFLHENPKKAQKYIDAAAERLKLKKAVVTDEQIKEEARILYNLEQIEKDIKVADKAGLLGNFVAIKTKEEFDIWVREKVAPKMRRISLKEQKTQKDINELVRLEEVVKAYENGDNGFNWDGESVNLIENMAANDQLEVRTHELGHEFVARAFGKNQKLFSGMAQAILEWAETNDQALYNRLTFGVQRDGGKLINEEVFTNFLEEVAGNRVDLSKTSNRGLRSILGFGVSQTMQDKYNIDINLAGVNDVVGMAVAIAKKIKQGKITEADITGASESEAAKLAEKRGEQLIRDGVFAISESLKKSKQTQKKIDDLGNKYTREEWTKFGADETLADIYEDLESLIRSKVFMFKNLPNFSAEDFVTGVLAELIPHIRNFNIDKKVDKGDKFGLSGWINSQLANKMGNVLKAKTATTETYSVDEDAEGFKERVETEDALETFEEEDLSIQAQLRERNLSQREGGDYEYSKFRRELEFNGEKGISNKMKQAIEAKTFEILSSSKYIDLPLDIISKNLQKDFEIGLKNIVQEQMGAESDYSNFLMKNMNTILKHLDIKSLTAMERQTPSKDRVMTRFVRRLTTKKDVQDAIDNGWLAHVDNPAQGPNLYEVLKPSVADYLKFYNPPSVIESPKKVKQWDAMPDAAKQQLAESTGKTLEQARRQFVETRSVKKGERKKVLAERIVGQLAFDATMQTVQGEAFAAMRAKAGKPVLAKAKIAELARRIDRGIEVKFSKKTISQGVASMSSDLINDAIKSNSITSNIEIVNIPKYKLYSQEDKQLAVDLADLLLKSSKIESEIVKFKKFADKPNIKRLLELHNMNIDEAIDSPNKDAYLSIRYSKKNRNEFTSRLKKKRPELTDKEMQKQIDAVFDFVDVGIETGQIPPKKKSKFEKLAFHYLVSGSITLPQDGYKIIEAARIADIKKFAPESYRNPNEIIENYADQVKAKVERTNPDEVKELSNKKLIKGKVKGVTVYDIEDSKAGQVALRKIIDTHWGKESDPWCITARNMPQSIAEEMAQEFEGEVDDFLLQQVMQSETFQQEASTIEQNPFDELASSFDHWKTYNYDGNGFKVSFVDGKLNSFRDGNNKEWWSRMDKPSDNLVATTTKRVGKSLHIYETDVVTGDKILVQEQLGTSGKNGPIINYEYPQTAFAGREAFDFDKDGNWKRKVEIKEERMIMRNGEIDSKVTRIYRNIDPRSMRYVPTKEGNITFNNIKLMEQSSEEGLGSLQQENLSKDQARKASERDGGVLSEVEVTGIVNTAFGPFEAYVGKEVTLKKTVFKDLSFSEKVTVDGLNIKFSKNLNKSINDMIERSRGLSAEQIISPTTAKKKGAIVDSKFLNRINFFIPPSADDFVGLTYYMMGKGEKGNDDMKFFKENLFDPYSKAYTELDEMRIAVSSDIKKLNENEVTKPVFDILKKNMPNSDYTYEDAIRVYLWDMHNHTIPGLSNEEVANLVGRVNAQPELIAYALGVQSASRSDAYIEPKEYWAASSILGDINRIVEGVHRANFLSEWKENKDEIFSKDNLNKLEAAYGTNYRDALEDMLYRMETGNSRPQGKNKINNKFINWLNGSVGSIMFFNTKSAVLQTISTVNFLNWEDNNIYDAGKAFANQPQYWKDFAMIYNSKFLKSRRSGLQTDIQHAELASAVSKASNKSRAALRYLLRAGFAPTQLADSFAIASGGATFYRNRVNKLIKEGMTEAEAEAQAFIDFREIAEETQQSARPDRVSQQQTSTAGRLILAFQNAPMQFNRMTKKAIIDLQKGRGNWKSNVSRIVYYGAVQNVIFLSLQQALFALTFEDEDEELRNEIIKQYKGKVSNKKLEKLISEEKEKRLKFVTTKYNRTLNGMADMLLRGSGITGAVISTLKNAAMKINEEIKDGPKGMNEYAPLVELLQISPQIGSKSRKIIKGFRSLKWDSEAIDQMSLLDTKNPIYSVTAPVVEGLTNIPLNRLLTKTNNLREMVDSENTAWQRAAMGLGWSAWDVGVDAGIEVDEAKKRARAEKKKERGQCKAVTSSGTRCKNIAGPSGRCYLHD